MKGKSVAMLFLTLGMLCGRCMAGQAQPPPCSPAAAAVLQANPDIWVFELDRLHSTHLRDALARSPGSELKIWSTYMRAHMSEGTILSDSQREQFIRWLLNPKNHMTYGIIDFMSRPAIGCVITSDHDSFTLFLNAPALVLEYYPERYSRSDILNEAGARRLRRMTQDWGMPID